MKNSIFNAEAVSGDLGGSFRKGVRIAGLLMGY